MANCFSSEDKSDINLSFCSPNSSRDASFPAGAGEKRGGVKENIDGQKRGGMWREGTGAQRGQGKDERKERRSRREEERRREKRREKRTEERGEKRGEAEEVR